MKVFFLWHPLYALIINTLVTPTDRKTYMLTHTLLITQEWTREHTREKGRPALQQT